MGLMNFEWVNGQRRPVGAIPLLKIEKISVRLGQRLVLDDISLDLYEGEQVRITGPNGAGKSTLLNAIMNVVTVTNGRILFKGIDIGLLATHERAMLGISYMRQRDNVFPSLTVSENLTLALGKDGYNLFQKNFPDWSRAILPQTHVGMLSGGQKQKLAWGMTVLSGGEVLLVDEPLAGVAADSSIMSLPFATTIFIEHN